MSDKLINTGPTVEFVPIVAEDGSMDTVSLQPGGHLTLSPIHKVAPQYSSEYHPKVLLNNVPLTNK